MSIQLLATYCQYTITYKSTKSKSVKLIFFNWIDWNRAKENSY